MHVKTLHQESTWWRCKVGEICRKNSDPAGVTTIIRPDRELLTGRCGWRIDIGGPAGALRRQNIRYAIVKSGDPYDSLKGGCQRGRFFATVSISYQETSLNIPPPTMI